MTAKVIQDLFYKNKLACAKAVKVVKAKGVATAYAQMHSRGDAQKAMERLNETKEILGGKHVKVKITKPCVRCLCRLCPVVKPHSVTGDLDSDNVR